MYVRLRKPIALFHGYQSWTQAERLQQGASGCRNCDERQRKKQKAVNYRVRRNYEGGGQRSSSVTWHGRTRHDWVFTCTTVTRATINPEFVQRVASTGSGERGSNWANLLWGRVTVDISFPLWPPHRHAHFPTCNRTTFAGYLNCDSQGGRIFRSVHVFWQLQTLSLTSPSKNFTFPRIFQV